MPDAWIDESKTDASETDAPETAAEPLDYTKGCQSAGCHEELGKTPSVHGPVSAGACDTCHEAVGAQGAGALRLDLGQGDEESGHAHGPICSGAQHVGGRHVGIEDEGEIALDRLEGRQLEMRLGRALAALRCGNAVEFLKS